MAKASSGRNKSLQSLDASFLEAIQGRVEPQFVHPLPEAEEKKPEPECLAEGERPVSKLRTATPGKPAVDPLESLKVIVSADGMEARLATRSSRRITAPVNPEALRELLAKEGVIFGIDEAAIATVTAAARQPRGWQGEIIVARGIEPTRQKIEYPFLRNIEKGKAGADSLAGDLQKLFQTESLESLLKADCKVRAVQPGEPVAVMTGGENHQQGQDVFGLPRQAQQESGIFLGEHVALAGDARTYAALIYGYLQFRNNRLAIVPPVWISPDRMQAYFAHLPQIGPPSFPAPEALEDVLITLGIKPGMILKEMVKSLCAELAAGKKAPSAVRIAEGMAPREGRNAEIELLFDPGEKAGALREDDTIDLRERNLFINAEPGQLLARKRLASKGVPGINLLGEKIEARNGIDLHLEARHGVMIERKDEFHSYIARTAGVVMYMGRSLAVAEMFHVKGDVDYATGNLEVAGNLHVAGTVRSGFSVRCGGDAIVEGVIEAGASVFVKGDLIVKHGIVGETTKVVVHGALRTMFIQDAEVIVKGDTWVGSHIYNGSVRSTGTLTVQRGIGTRGGRVVGGIVCAADRVHVSTVGSSGNRNTLVALQPDPQAMVQINKLGETIRVITDQVTRMLRALGLASLDAEGLRALLASVPPERRKQYVELLTQLNNSLKQKRHLEKKKKLLQAEIDTRLQQGAIRVGGGIYPGNRIQIGFRTYIAEREMGPTTFRLQNERIVFQ